MPIQYDPKKKEWEFEPETQEEYDAFLDIGKVALLQKLTEKFASDSFSEWLKLSKKMMFRA